MENPIEKSGAVNEIETYERIDGYGNEHGTNNEGVQNNKQMNDQNSTTLTRVSEQEASQTEDAGKDTPQHRMLFRHPSDKLLAGVCGGIADYLKWDPTLIRILWVVVTLATSGGGILAYGALWLLLPVGTSAGGQQQPAAVELNERNLGRAAFALISLGIVWLLANLGVLSWVWGSVWRVLSIVFWPILLIGAGYVILRYTRRDEWNWNWRSMGTQAQQRVREGVEDKLPSKGDVKQRIRTARDNFPLKRSRTDRIFMGVCGGIGQKIGIDANLVRLVWAAFSVGSIGMGVLLYVLVGLFLPEETPADQAAQDGEFQDVQIIDASAGKAA